MSNLKVVIYAQPDLLPQLMLPLKISYTLLKKNFSALSNLKPKNRKKNLILFRKQISFNSGMTAD